MRKLEHMEFDDGEKMGEIVEVGEGQKVLGARSVA